MSKQKTDYYGLAECTAGDPDLTGVAQVYATLALVDAVDRLEDAVWAVAGVLVDPDPGAERDEPQDDDRERSCACRGPGHLSACSAWSEQGNVA